MRSLSETACNRGGEYRAIQAFVEEIAEHFNMSKGQFFRKIKGVLNLTPNEYIRVERLKRAHNC